tara:strand:- start:235 stop:1239 length:1005 start_codon:yes stop_codon:yes gene_type:complete
MAIAPLNKFLTIAVPVAPGQQDIYKAPVGTSAIVLYAQVSNVGVNTTPSITFTHRRTSVATRTIGNVRNNRIIKDGEIPPNDALVLIDGRLVLERTALISDSLIINGNQSGISTINDVTYTSNTGLTTVTTLDPHGFSVNDQITMAGIAFTCPSTAGITSSIFPAPQAAFSITKIIDTKSFETNTGIVNNLPHTFRPSFHRFVRANTDALTVVVDSNGNASQGDTIAPTKGTSYDAVTGILSVTTAAPHNLGTNDTVRFTNNSVFFTCSQDNYLKEQSYPRSTDPANASTTVGVTTFTGNNLVFTVNVGVTTTGGLVAPLQMEFICSILENSTG